MKRFNTWNNRREFMRSCGRIAALGALSLAGGLILRRNPSAQQSSDCKPFPLCQGCSALEGCSLPQALSAKQPTREPHNG